MQQADFKEVVNTRLAAQRDEVTARLRTFFAAYPAADHFLFEYLFGLDHALMRYARRADDTELAPGDSLLFEGFGDYLRELAAHDQQHGTRLQSAFREDEAVRDLLDDWFTACWTAASGPDLPIPSYFMYEGDAARLNLQADEWE
ncbi:hypothetical protein GCM10027422_27420 [Hymenobacter arcticus]